MSGTRSTRAIVMRLARLNIGHLSGLVGHKDVLPVPHFAGRAKPQKDAAAPARDTAALESGMTAGNSLEAVADSSGDIVGKGKKALLRVRVTLQ
ncbi:hypothetical protein DDE01_09210 [Desulfovibrio desulfuricans]|nr:hypothetical protein DDE01_09210 [Desulfovibrio desulfuricans]